jgi:hypothetical protein
MFASWLNLAFDFGALFCVGFVARMVNDIFNTDYDICCGVRTFAAKVGRRALPYSILAVLLAAICNLHLTLGVFLASYAAGRICKSWEQESRVYAYVEPLFAILLCVLVLGIHDTIWAISFMCAVYWLDDIVEMNRDRESGHKNMANRFGVVFTLFVILFAFVISVLFDATWTVLALTAFSFLAIFFESTTTELVVNGS